jgi:hypothetical protein
MIRIRTALTLAAGVAAALALGGTALAAGGDDPVPSVSADDHGGAVPMLPNGDPIPTPTSDDPTSALGDPTSAATAAASVSIDAARSIALRAAGGGRVTDVEAETEHGRAVWDLDVVVGGVRHDIDVDRATGEVLRHRTRASSGTATTGTAGDDGRGRGSDDTGADDHGHGHGGHGSDD